MEKHVKTYLITSIAFFLSLLVINCGGNSTSSNKYLGELPGITKSYTEQIDALKKELKESTDMSDAFSLQKELDNLKDEAKETVNNYIAEYTFEPLPFEQKDVDVISVEEIKVYPRSKSISSLKIITSIKYLKNMTAEEIREKFGGFGGTINCYANVVDDKGASLEKLYFKATIPYSQEEYRIKEGAESEMKSSLYNLEKMENFDKIIFLPKEEFDKIK